VISGSAKGKRLTNVPKGVRPVSDRAREGLFSSLSPEVPGAVVLDLFAGTGALGIEALSRGAEHAVFVDRDRASIAAVRENLARTGLADRASIVASEVNDFLGRRGPEAGSFDLVLMDPPYGSGPADLDISLSRLEGWLSGEAWTVVLTRGTRSSTPVVPVDWVIARRLVYGDSLVICYHPRSQPRSQGVRWA
jgi:16S rRNA (guanine966-N2)-methyltransferase